ncbi:MAG: IPT/TIG domain-containing protein [Spirochaetales bacterium]|nr:IPT/TIG domain-containing protein [Spirochaetales bacterium]
MPKLQLSQLSWKGAVPILLFLVFVITLTIIVVLTGRDPVVVGIEPAVVGPGERIIIAGRHFGDSSGTLRLAGVETPSSAITEWTDERIVLTVPQSADSGLLFVVTDGGSSSGALLQMKSSVPRSGGASYTPGTPQISSLQQTEAQIGGILVIDGKNFGTQRRTSRVLFSASTDSKVTSPVPAVISYPVWTDEQIRVRVPSGTESGFVTVDTAWGRSNPMRLHIERPAGQLIRTDRSEIAVWYGASVADIRLIDDEKAPPGAADVIMWLPEVQSGLAQSNIRFLEPGAAGDSAVAGDAIHAVRFEGADESISVEAVRTVVANRFGLQLEINPSRVSPAYEGESGFFDYYTRATPTIPADSEAFATVAASVRQGRASPYHIARAVYDWILEYMDYALYVEDRGAIAGIGRASGDDYTYATLFVSVLRAARIPSRIVGGVLISGRNDAYPHFWAEFFVPALGWIPVDPSLGDGAFPAGFAGPEDPSEFYFGNLDSYRLAFHHGYAENGPDRRNGLHFTPADPYSSQRTYVEAGEAIRSLTVDWRSPRLISIRSW